jgi:hypothetical protein
MHNVIETAIKTRHLLSFRCDGGLCVVEPYALGSRSNRMCLLGWQTNGPKPGWRTFSVCDMQNMHSLEGTFDRVRSGYNPDLMDCTIQCSVSLGDHLAVTV